MTTYNIRVNATGQDLAIDWDAMPAATQEFIIQYGLRQKFNDCHVSAEGDDKSAMVDKTLAALMSGEIRIGAARATDRLGAAIRAVALPLAREHAKKTGHKLTKEYLASDEWKELVAKVCAKPIVVETAKASLAAANKIELGDL